MTDKRRDTFNFNHSSKDLSQEEIVEIKEIYKYYHKKHRPFKKSHTFYKTTDLSCKIASTGLVATGTIAGAITLNPIVLGVISGSGLILNTFAEAKNYKRKIEVCKFAYTTYEKILIDLWSHLRGVKFNEEHFFTEIRLIDQMITDLCPSVSIRFVVQEI